MDLTNEQYECRYNTPTTNTISAYSYPFNVMFREAVIISQLFAIIHSDSQLMVCLSFFSLTLHPCLRMRLCYVEPLSDSACSTAVRWLWSIIFPFSSYTHADMVIHFTHTHTHTAVDSMRHSTNVSQQWGRWVLTTLK